MKAKLLKKTRKRFEIIRYDSVSSDAPDYYLELKLPFYMVNYKHDSFNINSECFETYDKAWEHLKNRILNLYQEKFRHKNARKEKVWWVK